MPDAKDVAWYFLSQVDPEAGDNISNLKLQKLLYYAQGIHLAITGEPLFSDKLKRWEHGPVVPHVYYELQEYGAGAIPVPEGFDPFSFTEQQREILDDVYAVYGQFSAWKLRDMTHAEPPWRDTPAEGEITHQKLKEYFSTQIAV